MPHKLADVANINFLKIKLRFSITLFFIRTSDVTYHSRVHVNDDTIYK